mmetsp:Transcript_13976/g.22837  ORF Transcript_13976/g.22837 Transcript_13976/m.22837 type:complete len:104 (-) Transcript_13976:86-397(-)
MVFIAWVCEVQMRSNDDDESLTGSHTIPKVWVEGVGRQVLTLDHSVSRFRAEFGTLPTVKQISSEIRLISTPGIGSYRESLSWLTQITGQSYQRAMTHAELGT